MAKGLQTREINWRLKSMEMTKEAFLKVQEAYFDLDKCVKVADNPSESVVEKLRVFARSMLPLPESPRVIDVGCGTGCLIPFFKEVGVEDVLALELSQKMLDRLQEKFPPSPVLGNIPGVRVWKGDFAELPSYMGPVDVIVFNSVFGNFYDQREVLIKSLSLLQPGGQVVVSHPLGREWLSGFAKKIPDIIPHRLPADWTSILADLPLTVKAFTDTEDMYLTVLQIPEGYGFEGVPLFVEGEVILGRGIGSARLGVPTANLQPESFQFTLNGRPKGVYFGWAKVQDDPSGDVHAAVLNLGTCPTMKGKGEAISLEAHILHDFQEAFYGKTLRVAILGFLRPELRFSDIPALLHQIQTDIGKAKKQLTQPDLHKIKGDPFFTSI